MRRSPHSRHLTFVYPPPPHQRRFSLTKPTNTITACTVVAYKLLYKPWALSMGEGDFRPPTAPRPLDRFPWNLKYITTSRTRPRTQNFRGLCRRGWSGQIASLTHESFCRSRGLGAVGGRKSPSPIDKATGLYNSLYYRTSRDAIVA